MLPIRKSSLAIFFFTRFRNKLWAQSAVAPQGGSVGKLTKETPFPRQTRLGRSMVYYEAEAAECYL